MISPHFCSLWINYTHTHLFPLECVFLRMKLYRSHRPFYLHGGNEHLPLTVPIGREGTPGVPEHCTQPQAVPRWTKITPKLLCSHFGYNIYLNLKSPSRAWEFWDIFFRCPLGNLFWVKQVSMQIFFIMNTITNLKI